VVDLVADRSCLPSSTEIKNRHQGRVSSKGFGAGFHRERRE
jgi:hypothetical protein